MDRAQLNSFLCRRQGLEHTQHSSRRVDDLGPQPYSISAIPTEELNGQIWDFAQRALSLLARRGEALMSELCQTLQWLSTRRIWIEPSSIAFFAVFGHQRGKRQPLPSVFTPTLPIVVSLKPCKGDGFCTCHRMLAQRAAHP